MRVLIDYVGPMAIGIAIVTVSFILMPLTALIMRCYDIYLTNKALLLFIGV